MYGQLDTARLLVSALVLGYSCVTDWRCRRAPNQLWYVMGFAGLVFDMCTFWQDGFDAGYALWAFVGALFTFALVYLVFAVGGFGGADAKALIAIAIMFPQRPSLELAGMTFPAVDRLASPVFALSVLGNAIVITAALPPCTLAYNLLTVPVAEIVSNPLGAVTGYRAPVGQLEGRHLRLMHRYEAAGDRVERRIAFKGPELDDEMLAQLAQWRAAGRIGDRVWVTPQLPFLIPITLGFFASVGYGDILLQIVSALIG